MVTLDGSYGEGGGQIVRTALALSTIRKKAFEIINIRRGRKQPGLKAQHLHCIKALEKLCNAKTECASLGSDKLKYYPGILKGKNFDIDIGTAGSISLLLQSILLPAFFAEKISKITVTGGTCGKWATPFDFFNEIQIPHVKKLCKKIQVQLIKRGYYPKGGGKVEIRVAPKYKLNDFTSFEKFLEEVREENSITCLEQGKLMQIRGVSHASVDLENAHVAERQVHSAKSLLSKYNCPVNIRTEYVNTLSTGSGITLWAIFSKEEEFVDFDNPIRLGADALGEKGKRAEDVGKEAAEQLAKDIDSEAPIDSHLADQMLPFLALTKGSKIKVSEITSHCKTNMYVIEQFLGKTFEIDEENKIIST